MNRGYTAEKYLSLLEYARSVMPELSVTSDIIVGFPGETYEEFLDTVKLIEKAQYTSLYTFIFSPREGTRAAKMDDPVSREEKGKWFSELCAAQEKSRRCELLRWLAGNTAFSVNQKPRRTAIYRAERRGI